MPLIDFFAPSLARRLEARKLPAVAERQGLTFHEGERTDTIGTLDGDVRGHSITVRPDKPAIEIHYAMRVDNLSLSTWCAPRLRRPPVTFDSGVTDFDRRFRTRKAGPALAESLLRHRAFFEHAAAFAHRWRGELAQVDFSGTQMGAWFKARGLLAPDVCYIRADILEAMLPEMLDLVDELQEAVRP